MSPSNKQVSRNQVLKTMKVNKWLLSVSIFTALCGLVGGQLATPSATFFCSKNYCKENADCQYVDSCNGGMLVIDHKYPCSCCQKCISYIDEGETCNAAAIDKMCGPGLTCKSGKCLQIESDCITQQRKYDENKENGLVGLFTPRPSCDENGDFAGRKCQPGSSCYCVDIKGSRIFGEALASEAISDSAMNCDCSRDYLDMIRYLPSASLQFPHCLPNGNYDSLQCINQACYCLGPDYKPSAFVPYTAIEDLPCYNANVHNVDYLRVCEAEVKRKQKIIEDYARHSNITIVGLDVPNCTPDGFFAPVLKADSRYYCADPMGSQIESFEADINSPDAEDMSCNCARTRYLLRKEPVMKPACCKNGNYKRIQCRSGLCFCVDHKTGDQDQGENSALMEVTPPNINKLHCFSEYSEIC